MNRVRPAIPGSPNSNTEAYKSPDKLPYTTLETLLRAESSRIKTNATRGFLPRWDKGVSQPAAIVSTIPIHSRIRSDTRNA